MGRKISGQVNAMPTGIPERGQLEAKVLALPEPHSRIAGSIEADPYVPAPDPSIMGECPQASECSAYASNDMMRYMMGPAD